MVEYAKSIKYSVYLDKHEFKVGDSLVLLDSTQ